jgi:hypothetical protein
VCAAVAEPGLDSAGWGWGAWGDGNPPDRGWDKQAHSTVKGLAGVCAAGRVLHMALCCWTRYRRP